MLSLRTSQVKNINIDINYKDLVAFIEMSFHKREGKFSYSKDCRNQAKLTMIKFQMVKYFLFLVFFALCPSCYSYD